MIAHLFYIKMEEETLSFVDDGSIKLILHSYRDHILHAILRDAYSRPGIRIGAPHVCSKIHLSLCIEKVQHSAHCDVSLSLICDHKITNCEFQFATDYMANHSVSH